MKANPTVTSEIADREFETCLEVASRWNHLRIVKYFIKNLKFPLKELKSARRKSTNKSVQLILEKQIKKIKSETSCILCKFCFRCFRSRKNKIIVKDIN